MFTKCKEKLQSLVDNLGWRSLAISKKYGQADHSVAILPIKFSSFTEMEDIFLFHIH